MLELSNEGIETRRGGTEKKRQQTNKPLDEKRNGKCPKAVNMATCKTRQWSVKYSIRRLHPSRWQGRWEEEKRARMRREMIPRVSEEGYCRCSEIR